MGLAWSVVMDPSDVQRFSAWCKAAGRKVARSEIGPILKEHLAPLVAHEKSTLAGHSKSGALARSLQERMGPGDRPGTISVFAAATATAAQLKATWGKHGRAQQRRWASGLKTKGRRMVFYADFVEKGHRIVKKNAQGEYEAGKAAPVPFAAAAAAALGDQEADAASAAIMDHILNG